METENFLKWGISPRSAEIGMIAILVVFGGAALWWAQQ